MGLNPRFDGAFLNLSRPDKAGPSESFRRPLCLNPRFDGAFLNLNPAPIYATTFSLNPRFDGAFLNLYYSLNPKWDI